MKDVRLVQLAKTLVNHSIELQETEKVMISGSNIAKPLIKEVIREVYRVGGVPFLDLREEDMMVEIAKKATRDQLEVEKGWYAKKVEDVDAFIHIRAEENDAEMSDIPSEVLQMAGEVMQEVDQVMINQRKWVLINYPTPAAAQKARMSSEKFEDYLLEVCSLDYKKLAEAQKALQELMENTDKVRIVAPDTDLSFSIKDIPKVASHGKRNVPDGEIFTSPVKESVNGTISFNTPCPYRGVTFNNVSLTFKDGKIVDAVADETEKINEIFDLDEGARYIGEFAIGLNPLINKPMGEILFDEKINGSIHFTPGQAYENADNGNRSMVHWDMVLILREEYGGGELYFDDQLVQKNGKFVIDSLKQLNPEEFLKEPVEAV
ncbi:aminopeptidase [Pseudalkalibacillus caeni]|uniref:Aminopeptidase n=1 Tax=Exobacillus caeni TaxID=2574798 RepID=A0A5R9EYZ0_9BACL|nr:aminopeptidase [Pseudalkalibacillus caeni]TLS36051.1 aminopeptidase [Pseudalkalibacillus caeni]